MALNLMKCPLYFEFYQRSICCCDYGQNEGVKINNRPQRQTKIYMCVTLLDKMINFPRSPLKSNGRNHTHTCANSNRISGMFRYWFVWLVVVFFSRAHNFRYGINFNYFSSWFSTFNLVAVAVAAVVITIRFSSRTFVSSVLFASFGYVSLLFWCMLR